jgi:hypothetical protein
MPDGTLRLPTRPPPRGYSATSRRRRRPPFALIVVVVLVAAGAGVWFWWDKTIGSSTLLAHCTATASGDTYELDPGQAGNAAVITEVAVRRKLPARAATIAIATALQESKLRNLTYGDLDSVGLFQQRPSQGWGTRAQLLDPVYATNAFYDKLVKIKGYSSMSITKVAQKIQRSAFPSAYADHEDAAKITASALSGYSPAGFTCALHAAGTTAQSAASTGLTGRATALVKAARKETGESTYAKGGAAGIAVTYTVAGGNNDREGWALASWAVARADGLDVVEVDVAGQKWLRSDSGHGWTRSRATLADGQVRIRVS